jgi:hypothetical protein
LFRLEIDIIYIYDGEMRSVNGVEAGLLYMFFFFKKMSVHPSSKTRVSTISHKKFLDGLLLCSGNPRSISRAKTHIASLEPLSPEQPEQLLLNLLS